MIKKYLINLKHISNMQNIATVVVGVIAVVALGVAVLGGGTEKVREVVKQGDSVGAVASPDLSSNYFSFGDIRRHAAKDTTMTQASTTVCALQAPSATSTLVSGEVRFNTGSSTALNVGFGKGTTKFATSTALNAANLTGGAQGTLAAQDPEGASFDEDNVFGPDEWLLVQAFGGITAGDSGTGFTPSGVCQATWEQI